MKLGKTWVVWLSMFLMWGAQAAGIADQLKGRDHVLLMRHAYAPGVGDPQATCWSVAKPSAFSTRKVRTRR